jgi:hypothetical protein
MSMIKKFTIEIDETTYEMNYEQAEKLYNVLSKIFQKQVTYVPPNSYVNPYPPAPWLNPPYVVSDSSNGTCGFNR